MLGQIQIEVCLDRAEDAMSVQAAGATRIEINSALRLDGLTPSLATCRWLKENCGIPIIAMLRSHNDGFRVDSTTQQILERDAELLIGAGVDGIVYGALDAAGKLNANYFKQIAAICGSRTLVCHRAFDTLRDPQEGLEILVECGVQRVLTSGGAANAELGIPQLRKLQEWSRGRIEILPGGGINYTNAARILRETGCTQLHGTFRGPIDALRPDSARTDCELVRELCRIAQHAMASRARGGRL